jgi:ribonuclease J
MRKNVTLGRQMGILKVPDPSILEVEDLDGLDPGQVCIISTGSQGEPMSALALMAANESRFVTVGPDDTVILSSHPIPGNEYPVNKVIDGLTRLGVEVIHSDLADVHATGHAQREELKLFHAICQPEFFVPVHGEYRHMKSHAKIAVEMGMAPDHVLVCEDGDQILLTDDGLERAGHVPAGYLYVDGIVGDVGHGVLRDRRVLAEEGVVVVVVTIDAERREILTGPEVITRGWVHAPEAEPLLKEAAEAITTDLEAALAKDGNLEIEHLQKVVRRAAGRFVNERTRRRPMIVPVVMEA